MPHAERIVEMWRVVALEDPAKNLELERELPAWVDALSQGARLDGIYQSIVRSDHYRERERRTPGPSRAIGIFARELSRLQKLFPEGDRRQFTSRDAEPLARPVMPETLALESTLSADPARPVDSTEAGLIEGFSRASVFTLKRVLSEEVLRYFSRVDADPELWAKTYGEWVVTLQVYPVDLGLETRSRKEPEFHTQWARTAPRDVAYWELLNRVHRILNQADL